MTIEEAKEYLLNVSYMIGTTAVEYMTQKDGEKIREAIEALTVSSAQPEIIRCKDCMHGVHSGRGDIYLCTVSPEEVREHKYDFYCGYAERRTD